MTLIRSSFFYYFFPPIFKSISGIKHLPQQILQGKCFPAISSPACSSPPAHLPDQIRCTTRCLFCCPGVEHQEPLDCDQLDNSEQTHGNKHNHPYLINHSLTGNLHLDFSEFRARFLYHLWFPGDPGQLEQNPPLCQSQCKVKASSECHWPDPAACALCIYPLQREGEVRSCGI